MTSVLDKSLNFVGCCFRNAGLTLSLSACLDRLFADDGVLLGDGGCTCWVSVKALC